LDKLVLLESGITLILEQLIMQ